MTDPNQPDPPGPAPSRLPRYLETHPQPLSKSTTVTFGFVLALCAAVVSLCALAVMPVNYLNSRLGGIEEVLVALGGNVSEISFSVREIRGEVRDMSADMNGKVSREEFKAWTEILEARNPDMDVNTFDG